MRPEQLRKPFVGSRQADLWATLALRPRHLLVPERCCVSESLVGGARHHPTSPIPPAMCSPAPPPAFTPLGLSSYRATCCRAVKFHTAWPVQWLATGLHWAPCRAGQAACRGQQPSVALLGLGSGSLLPSSACLDLDLPRFPLEPPTTAQALEPCTEPAVITEVAPAPQRRDRLTHAKRQGVTCCLPSGGARGILVLELCVGQPLKCERPPCEQRRQPMSVPRQFGCVGPYQVALVDRLCSVAARRFAGGAAYGGW